LKVKYSGGDKLFLIIDYILVTIVVIATLYPFLYVLSSSISDPDLVMRGQITLFPKGINFEAYKLVLKEKDIWVGYYNTLWYVFVGTSINILMTTLAAYPLSRKKFAARNTVMMIMAFTMFFGGGMVPTYILIKNVGIMNSRWAMVIPGAISTWNLIIMRTFFENIPESLHEAAFIDGANDLKILAKIILPLSKPVIAVMILFYSVGHWNSFFNALLYLNTDKLYPLQMVLRKILIQYDVGDMMQGVKEDRGAMVGQSIRYATIVISILPIICIYPFMQKYFVQGVMIGAIKE